MILPIVIEKTSYEDISKNLDVHVNNFLHNGVLIFKSLSLEETEQLAIMEQFASRLNWGHIAPHDKEDHSLTIDMWGSEIRSDAEILIHWHLEHSHKNDRQIAGSWHMTTFDCPKTSGTTGFVNTDDVLSQMSEDWIHLLRSSIVCNAQNGKPVKPIYRNAIIAHRNTGREILNLPPRRDADVLISVNNKPPTNEHLDKFKSIMKFIEKTAQSHDVKPEYWHEWSINDLVIIDLSMVYHAVKGGFQIGQREFKRYWAYSSEDSKHRSDEQDKY